MITARDLSALAERCGTAKQIQEDEFLFALQHIVQARTTLSTVVAFIGAMECRARREAVLLAWDALFPNMRRSLMLDPARCHIAVWQSDDAHLARYYDAKSLTLAMARAIFGELALQMEKEQRETCPDCRGHGHYIGTDGAKALCHHEGAREMAS